MGKQRRRSRSPDETEIPFRAMECPFCNPSEARIFLSGDQVFCLWDAYPVSPGHALLIPRRHIPAWFEATSQEHVALISNVAAWAYGHGARLKGSAWVAGDTVEHLPTDGKAFCRVVRIIDCLERPGDNNLGRRAT
jgi:hypothetical protein